MFAKLHSIEVHLDLNENRYRGIPVEPDPIDFNAVSTVYRDYSTHTFEALENWRFFPRFQLATQAARTLRWRSIRVIAKVAAQHAQIMAEAPTTSLENVASMIATYNRLKTFRIFPLSCIPDALACLFFLRDQGCKADFVIGVRENPFRAHAWLEINGTVANDVVANVFNYTPILRTSRDENLREISP
ncbi:lasso peptide biosynthesis B2 protein [Ensifer sp. YR511]|uniref:lasso peptide biosynthesis B2 protein n=1 Tax=Ensifer sp. YR511 TaxID=1855294 RepID=UPI000B7F0C08|nr:lasso peptide biosynthesis B2 protein [Ensifer sp. YR511]